jgi:hypothetical protein
MTHHQPPRTCRTCRADLTDELPGIVRCVACARAAVAGRAEAAEKRHMNVTYTRARRAEKRLEATVHHVG